MCFLLQGSSSINCKPTCLIFKLRPIVKCVLVSVRNGGVMVWYWIECTSKAVSHSTLRCGSAACCDFCRCVSSPFGAPLAGSCRSWLSLKPVWCYKRHFQKLCERVLPTKPSLCCLCLLLQLPNIYSVGAWTVAGSLMDVQDSLLTPDLE